MSSSLRAAGLKNPPPFPPPPEGSSHCSSPNGEGAKRTAPCRQVVPTCTKLSSLSLARLLKICCKGAAFAAGALGARSSHELFSSGGGFKNPPSFPPPPEGSSLSFFAARRRSEANSSMPPCAALLFATGDLGFRGKREGGLRLRRCVDWVVRCPFASRIPKRAGPRCGPSRRTFPWASARNRRFSAPEGRQIPARGSQTPGEAFKKSLKPCRGDA